MKLSHFTFGADSVSQRARSSSTDDDLGRGMDLALTVALFLGIGLLVDHWLGTSPVFTIALIFCAAVGAFLKMKYSYNAAMERLEADRRERLQNPQTRRIEDLA